MSQCVFSWGLFRLGRAGSRRGNAELVKSRAVTGSRLVVWRHVKTKIRNRRCNADSFQVPIAEQDVWCLNVSIRFNLSTVSTDCLALGSRFVTLASHTVAWRGGKPMNIQWTSHQCHVCHVVSRLSCAKQLDITPATVQAKTLLKTAGSPQWSECPFWILHLRALEMQMPLLDASIFFNTWFTQSLHLLDSFSLPLSEKTQLHGEVPHWFWILPEPHKGIRTEIFRWALLHLHYLALGVLVLLQQSSTLRGQILHDTEPGLVRKYSWQLPFVYNSDRGSSASSKFLQVAPLLHHAPSLSTTRGHIWAVGSNRGHNLEANFGTTFAFNIRNEWRPSKELGSRMWHEKLFFCSALKVARETDRADRKQRVAKRYCTITNLTSVFLRNNMCEYQVIYQVIYSFGMFWESYLAIFRFDADPQKVERQIGVWPCCCQRIRLRRPWKNPPKNGRFAAWIPWRKLGKLRNLGKIRITRTSQNFTFLFIKSLNACFIFLYLQRKEWSNSDIRWEEMGTSSMSFLRRSHFVHWGRALASQSEGVNSRCGENVRPQTFFGDTWNAVWHDTWRWRAYAHELAWIGMNWHELAWIGMNWHELAWIGMNWHELAWIGMNWHERRWMHIVHTCHILDHFDRFRTDSADFQGRPAAVAGSGRRRSDRSGPFGTAPWRRVGAECEV